jgi:hypothetical protein
MSELNARIGRTIAGPFGRVLASPGHAPLGDALPVSGQREGDVPIDPPLAGHGDRPDARGAPHRVAVPVATLGAGRDTGPRWARAIGRFRQRARAMPAAWVLLAALISHLTRTDAGQTPGNGGVARGDRGVRSR